ncbi:pPIWI_RE module domain-containing protein [Kitasatospora sp. NPDC127121]|uniref:pPIWI_RE module domain-containing protein n=1 Tax=Kitasatospora sp. NPDC127121 TaxID=3345371 RepID=UPI00363398C1
MALYDTLRRAAYVSTPDASPWTVDYLALPFPEHLNPGVLELCNIGRTEQHRWQTAPTRRLDGALQTLAPDLIVRPRHRPPATVDGSSLDDFWLYRRSGDDHPLPDPLLSRFLTVWLRTLGRPETLGTPEHHRLLLKVATGIEKQPPSWQPVSGIALLQTPTSKGGTAIPSALQFQLATDELARRIATLPPYTFEGGELRFRTVTRGPRQQGAELMSQPLQHVTGRASWWYSILLNVTLHTVPFDPRPRLHLHLGVRRWATRPRTDTGRLNLRYQGATSVYLRPALPWLPGLPLSSRWSVARLARDRQAQAFDWLGNDPAGLLKGLSLDSAFPAPDKLLAEPEPWLAEDGSGIQAAVVHSTRMGAHAVGTGLMPQQRSAIIAWAEQALPDGLIRVPDLKSCGTRSAQPANARPKSITDQYREGTAQLRRVALAVDARRRTGTDGVPTVEIRLLWQSNELRKSATEALIGTLGLCGDGGAPVGSADQVEAVFEAAGPGSPVVLEWQAPELTVQLRCLPLTGGLADPLQLDPSVPRRGARLAQGVSSRRSAIRDHLLADGAVPGTPALALVEIAHPSVFRPADTDPKFAMRLGCADSGVLTQFTVVPDTVPRALGAQQESGGSLPHRLRSAWEDGLRQLGVRALPQLSNDVDLPADLRYAALWMVKRRKDGPTLLPKHLPVAVLVTPAAEHVGLAQVQGWDDDPTVQDWIPYPELLLKLVRKAEIDPTDGHPPQPLLPAPRSAPDDAGDPAVPNRTSWRANLAQQRRETASFIQRMLFSLRTTGGRTVLITHSQNSRMHWPWLQDGRVEPDAVEDGAAGPRGLDPGLRLVRIRGGAGRETPQGWGLAEDGGDNGIYAGLWGEELPAGVHRPLDHRVFYSTTRKPVTFTKTAVTLDRLALRRNSKGNLVNEVGKQAWNPALVEIAVLGCRSNGSAAGDRPEALALAMHQLRHAPEYTDPISMPLPLHLAGLAQEYVLPMQAEGGEQDPEQDDSGDAAAAVDPSLAPAPGLAVETDPEEEGQLQLF